MENLKTKISVYNHKDYQVLKYLYGREYAERECLARVQTEFLVWNEYDKSGHEQPDLPRIEVCY